MKRMINQPLIWEGRNPQQEPVWLQKAQMHNRPLGQAGEVCWSLLWPWKGIWDNLTVWYQAWFTQGWIERKASILSTPKDCTFKVRVGATLSDEFGTEEGVPTGGVLAVTCFGLKINDLTSHIPPDIFRALFVDDLAICSHAIERHLQDAMDAIQRWALQKGFKFAAHKCKILYFTAPRHKPEWHPNIRIGYVALPVEEKFLGLWWDSKLNFGKHIAELKK